MLIVSQVLDPVFICSPWEMSLLRKRISVLLFLDLLCQVTGQKILKSPGHVSQNLLSSNSSVGNDVQTFFPCFSQSCPDLLFFPLTFSSGSSLQRCYLRVILLFSLICKHLHASWAANSKEVIAAQQSLRRAEQRCYDCKDAACNKLWPASPCQTCEQEWKEDQLFPTDHPGLNLHLSEYTVIVTVKSFGLVRFPFFVFFFLFLFYALIDSFSNYCFRSFSHVVPLKPVGNIIINTSVGFTSLCLLKQRDFRWSSPMGWL